MIVLTNARATASAPRSFEIEKGDEREIAPGITLGISDIDPVARRVYGWIWLKGDGRSLIVRAQPAFSPLVFYQGGSRRELRFTGLSTDSAVGRLTVSAN